VRVSEAWRFQAQVVRHGKENEVLMAVHGVIRRYVDKQISNPAPARHGR